MEFRISADAVVDVGAEITANHFVAGQQWTAPRLLAHAARVAPHHPRTSHVLAIHAFALELCDRLDEAAAMAERAAKDGTALPDLYWRYHRIWTSLGIPAFIAFILIFYLMVIKPA